MRFKKSRIVWSVMWGLSAILFCELWLRTLQHQDKVAKWISNSYYVAGDAYRHWMEVSIAKPQQPQPLLSENYPEYYYRNFVAHPFPGVSPIHRWHVGSGEGLYSSGIALRIPIWVAVVSSVIGGILPWVLFLSHLKRFSLRTLLVFITFISLALGLIIYFTKK